jgi:hypothetical protein
VLVFAIACSTNHRTTQPDRTKDAVAPTPPPADATMTTSRSIDAMPPGPTPEEIEEALHSLSSEHGARDIKNQEWWKTNAPYVRAHLRAMLEDGKDNMQSDRWAMRILGDLGDPADVPLLANVLTTWELDTAQMAAASALGAHPAPEARDALIEVTKLDNAIKVGYAASALGHRKDDPATRARLEELLDHKDSDVRYRTVNALAKLGGSKAALEKRKKVEKDADVKSALAKALKGK